MVAQICSRLAQQSLYIADGHHRYESALAYQRERRGCSKSISESEPFDFVMMTLVDFADPGLVIFPVHRLVRGLAKSVIDGLLDRLRVFFEVEELPLHVADIRQQLNDLLAKEDSGIKLVLYGLSKEHLFVLRLRNFSTVSLMMPQSHSELYKKLDYTKVLHNVHLRLPKFPHGIQNYL